MERLEAPLDYRVLWTRLYHDLSEVADEIARRCVTERDMTRVARHQGAYEFVQNIQAKMDELLVVARQANAGVFSQEDAQ